jgi:hypothetical protein
MAGEVGGVDLRLQRGDAQRAGGKSETVNVVALEQPTEAKANRSAAVRIMSSAHRLATLVQLLLSGT